MESDRNVNNEPLAGVSAGSSKESHERAAASHSRPHRRIAAGIAHKEEGKASRNKRRKRESLLNNAFDLFTQKGISDTTIADIAERAGVAKGTFYLYFKDKYDLRDRLVRHKAEQILEHAYLAMQSADRSGNRPDTLEDQVIFFVDNILQQLSDNRVLLRFIAKNLSWGLLKHDMEGIAPSGDDTPDFITSLTDYFHQSAARYRNPEVLLYMIVEFIGSTAYSSILNAEPLPFDTLKPYLLQSVRAIMRAQEFDPEADRDSHSPLPAAAH